ncbi:MAG: CRISPR-associated endonuclease Cas1 [Rhodobacteraceae bacterium]|nr:CRISPR-associated endonuclease Cas1 [Paracoccaceae bacterium]
MSRQPELPLNAPVAAADTPLVPVRMVNEHVYCPRLAYLMWVDKEWAETADTADGKRVHARADTPSGGLPDEDDAAFRTTALTLSSVRMGIIGKLDVVEGAGRVATPIDYKRGKRPHVARGVYQPERVQLALQAMLLEEHGFTVPDAAIWYAGSRERVTVDLDDELRQDALRAISELRLSAAAHKPPPPLIDSPKCPRCALAGICLPDEINLIRKGVIPRPLNPADDPALPLHVQIPGARVRKAGDTLVVETDENRTEIPMIHVSDLVLHGPVSVTTPAVGALLSAGVPVAWMTTGGWFLGHARPLDLGSFDTRLNQYRVADNVLRRRQVASGLIAAKIRNQRTILRRNWKAGQIKDRDRAMTRLRHLAETALHAPDTTRLLGIEGEAASIYFRHFSSMLTDTALPGFRFERRNRRPPADPINALLSYAYALATRSFSAALARTGFDPTRGVFHKPRHGRLALALDMMEPFRPILSDSTVLTLVNNREVAATDFVYSGASCAMKPAARKAIISAWERRLEQEAVHPVFGYRISMRRIIDVQCRLLARHLSGELETLPQYTPR